MSESRFNPNDHLVQLKSKQGSQDYLPVQWRLVWFRNQCPEGSITTEMLHLDLDREVTVEAYVWNATTRKSEKVMKTAKGIAVFRATVTDGSGIATGTGSESAADFADFIEKAETKAIGRALAALGYGTQFAPELSEGRVVDAPVDTGQNGQNDTEGPSEQQRESIGKLWTRLKKSGEPKIPATHLEAKKLIASLVAEYKEVQANKSQAAS